MKRTGVLMNMALCLLVWPSSLAVGQPGDTGFTYVGQLSVADGLYDLRFMLHHSSSGGNRLGDAVDVDGLVVVDGCFTASLDFGRDVPENLPEIALRSSPEHRSLTDSPPFLP